jgi:site-specific recombinase XerD
VGAFLDWYERNPVAATRADIEDYLDAWATATNVAPGTIRVRIAALRKFYDFLDSRGVLIDAEGRELRNPTDKVERPRSRRKANDWLSAEESAALLSSPITAQERAIVDLLFWTGLRVGEACALTWRDVDLERGEIRVQSAKTDSGMRAVLVLPELDAGLRDWRAYLERQGLYRPDAPLLATKRGTPTSPQRAWAVLKRVAERGGVRARSAIDRSGDNVSTISPHTLRRTFATTLINRGVRLETISKALGHADVSTTAAYYAELMPEQVRMEILDAMR